ncbi:STAS domain-containing protein [Actinoplanes sp. NPDC051346]|uniref:STAS domain-containing protein n=1 Tax=Actinoplanes sp. NPDC051346 TaxID=3155048 RepID=UPI0034438BD3
MVVTVAGVVAYQSPDQIPGAVRAAVARWAPRQVLLDVGDVSVLDGAGISALLASYQEGTEAGISVELINAGAFLSMQLREAGLAGALCSPDLAGEEILTESVPTVPRPRSTGAA